MDENTGADTNPSFEITLPTRFDEWDCYFHTIAEIVALKSKDERSPVGAVIVSDQHIILSTGFNGLARGIFDDKAILDEQDEKLRWICHAETNAIFNASRAGVSLTGATIYTTKFPCFACCNAIVQSGISKIFTYDKSYWDGDPFDGKSDDHFRKKKLFKMCKTLVVMAPLHPDHKPMGKSGIIDAATTKRRILQALDDPCCAGDREARQ